MAIKTILVHLPSVKSAQDIMPAVAKIAGSRNAHVIGLHVSQPVPLTAELTAELPPDFFDKLQEASRKNADAVKEVFVTHGTATNGAIWSFCSDRTRRR